MEKLHCLSFIRANHSKIMTPAEWCVLFGIKMIDPDGWRDGADYSKSIGMIEFAVRAHSCTILPIK